MCRESAGTIPRHSDYGAERMRTDEECVKKLFGIVLLAGAVCGTDGAGKSLQRWNCRLR